MAAISDNHQEYAARPFVVSGTCKQENAEAHLVLLRQAVMAVKTHFAGTGRKVYSIASDGESRRGKALGLLTMPRELDPSSPLYAMLRPLPLFNCLVGIDDLVCDKDWRHVFKRFRNALLRSTPLQVNGTSLTRPLIRHHLTDALNMPRHTADSLLSPNDPQDVLLAFRLLNSISSLPPPPQKSTPLYYRARRTLTLLGCIYTRLLRAYTCVTLSLRDQLEELSAVAHMLFALYVQDKGRFIPAILYLDAQIMIKNVYFCAAKTIVDQPDDGRLWIILLGTDGLEEVFGLVRTMVGCDANTDQLQLANRINGAVQCTQILQEHPDWDRGSRRLAVPQLQNRGDNVPAAVDHVNPKSWLGDVSVKNIVLQTCWYRGRQLAEGDLAEYDLTLPENAAPNPVDVLCPFGDGKIVYLGGLRADDVDEEDLQCSTAASNPSPDPSEPTLRPGQSSVALEPDIEDISAVEDVLRRDPRKKIDAYLPVSDAADAAKQHKSTFCRLLRDDPEIFAENTPESTDRLGRIRGYTRFPTAKEIGETNLPDGTPELGYDDPAVTLLRIDGLLFLAVVEICDIRRGGQSMCSLAVQELRSPDVRVKFEVLSLRGITPSAENGESDWEWMGQSEKFRTSVTCEVEGRAILPIDPKLALRVNERPNSRSRLATYEFRTVELCAFACELFQAGLADIVWAEATTTPGFPYRTSSGERHTS